MTGSEEYNRILRVESYVKKVAGAFRPKVAVVLGSGLGNYGESESVTSKFELPYSEIPISELRSCLSRPDPAYRYH